MINKTECKNCVKQDVCSIKDKYDYSIKTIENVTVATGADYISYVKNDKDVFVTISCSRYVQTVSNIR